MYEKTDLKVIITCPIHGDFKQVPSSHLLGIGCAKCGCISSANNRIEKGKISVIEDFKKVHGDFYNYDKTVYITSKESVTITCPIHGDFRQTPLKHKQGRGCPKCKYEKLSLYQQQNPTGWKYSDWQKAGERSKNFDSFKVYIIKCWNEDEEFYKIGKTFLTVKKRFFSKIRMPYNYDIEKVIESKTDARYISEIEKQLQKLNKNNKYLPKTNFHGAHECFSTVNEDDLK